MRFLHLSYNMPLYRPPSEALSLILQPTIGCSYNKCSFCELYKGKTFSIRPEYELFREIDLLGGFNKDVRRVFFADGNAFVLSTDRLLRLTEHINKTFPKVHRMSAYALPKDIASKSVEELTELKRAGLNLLYVGVESGDDDVLKMVNKNENTESTINALLKARQAGIKISVMIINGLAGSVYSYEHAVNSAKIINEIQPEYLSSLVLSLPFGKEKYADAFDGDFIEMDKLEILREMELFVSHLELDKTVYRSDHISNYVALRGTLNRDKTRLIHEIRSSAMNPEVLQFDYEMRVGI